MCQTISSMSLHCLPLRTLTYPEFAQHQLLFAFPTSIFMTVVASPLSVIFYKFYVTKHILFNANSICHNLDRCIKYTWILINIWSVLPDCTWSNLSLYMDDSLPLQGNTLRALAVVIAVLTAISFQVTAFRTDRYFLLPDLV